MHLIPKCSYSSPPLVRSVYTFYLHHSQQEQCNLLYNWNVSHAVSDTLISFLFPITDYSGKSNNKMAVSKTESSANSIAI